MNNFYIRSIGSSFFSKFSSTLVPKSSAIVVRQRGDIVVPVDGYALYARFAASQHYPIEAEHVELMDKYSGFARSFNEAINKEIHDARFEAYRKNGADNIAINKSVREVYKSIGYLSSTKSIRDKYAQGAATDDVLFLSRHIARMNARGHTTCLYIVFMLMLRDLKKYGSPHGLKLEQAKSKYNNTEKMHHAVHTTCLTDKIVQEMNEENNRMQFKK